MNAAAIAQANLDRKALGLSLLPVPGAAPTVAAASFKDSAVPTDDPDDEPASTLETREAQAYDNFAKVQKEKDAKQDRLARVAAIRKARDRAQMNKQLEGKGIADDDDEGDADDALSWLKSSKKRQKAIRARDAKAAAAEAKAAAAAAGRGADMAGVEVGHDASAFLDGDHVLTLKDRDVLDEGEADELEDIGLKEQEELEDRLKLKRKAPTYDPNDSDEAGEGGILSKYDEEIGGKKRRFFKLQSTATSSADITDILEGSAPVRRKRANVDAELLDDAPAPPPPSDYLDISEIKVKKVKKSKKSKSHRQRRAGDDDVLFDATQPETAADADEQPMDVDSGAAPTKKKKKPMEDNFGDDEDLQDYLAVARKRALKKNKTKPEDIARMVKQEEASQSPEPGADEGGIILDDVKGFVDALHSTDKDEPRQRKARVEPAVTAMDQDVSDEDEVMKDAATAQGLAGYHESENELTTTGVEEEKLVSQGVGSTLSLLRDRGVISKEAARQGVELNQRVRHSEQFKADLRRHMAEFDEQTRQQRERDRQSGRLDRMSAREREQWQQQQNGMREQHQSRIVAQLFQRSYQPNVELRYVDADGRRLSAKEAFKELSHQFHGKGSGKGKTDKLIKRLAEEKRKMAESLLDVSQNVGMSSAATHQGKKRKEAGVRLA